MVSEKPKVKLNHSLLLSMYLHYENRHHDSDTNIVDQNRQYDEYGTHFQLNHKGTHCVIAVNY